MSRLGNTLARGSARALTAFVAGALTVLALPPFSVLFVAPVAYGALYLLPRDSGPWAAFALGWLFGAGYFAFGLSWVAESFQVDGERFGALAIPAVAGLSAGLAIFPALATVGFSFARRTRLVAGPMAPIAFAVCWAAAEWLRGHVLTGFPWNLAAYALVEFDALRQPAAWFGSYGLSFLVVLASVLPAQAVVSRGAGRRAALASFGLIIGIVWIAGELRLAGTAPPSTGVSVRIVQGNVPQTEKWRPGNRDTTLSRYLDLSAQGDPVDAVLWPETAFPGFLDEDLAARARIAEALPENGVLLTGVPDRIAGETEPLYFNTIQAYDRSGEILTGYAKHHLVPFGEYVPFRRWVPLERLTEGLGDFTPGPGPRTLAVPGLPLVAPVICYEIVFPGHVVDRLFRPSWIFNATNDAWFGTYIGPEQHLASTRMRAVEEGLPVIRAANTGISAVIDASGTILQRLEIGETGVIDADLPDKRPRTIYGRLGDWTFLGLTASFWVVGGSLNGIGRRAAKRRRWRLERP